MARILVAMSGGVDSSVAAARLLAAGHEVVGVTLHLWDYPPDGGVKGRCCAPEDVYDASRVASQLGIAHYTFDRRDHFRRAVVDPFVDAYLEGTTPNPCVHCNRQVKVPELLHLADAMGASAVATGHYARILDVGGRLQLHRGLDPLKDQSYFLYALRQEQLQRLIFPLGDAKKAEVRSEALRLGLHAADKGESQELCFVDSGRYDQFVRERADGRLRPGLIVDAEGRAVGQHQGIHQFTLGQRRKLGTSVGRRAYVTALEPDTATVRLGHYGELARDWALLGDVVFEQDEPLPTEVDCVIRYRGSVQRARFERAGDGVRVTFEAPVAAVVPGQFAVAYQATRLLGGGRIIETGTGREQLQAVSSAVDSVGS